jgi:hypothetical protein
MSSELTGGDMTAPVRTAWVPLVAETISAEEIDALLSRRVPYVHVPRFLDPAWCAEIAGRFAAAIEGLPDHQSLTMGPALLDSLAKPVEMFVDSSDPDEYFRHVARDAPRVRMLFEGGEDPLEKMRRAWQGAGWREVPAAEDEHRRYLPDAIWGLRKAAAPPHVDAYEHERDIALSRFGRHFNYNVYFQNAESGGEFAVYNRYADGGTPGARPEPFEPVLTPERLSDTERVEHRPAPGDLVIFDAMLYHEVTPVEGSRKARIQIHSNMLIAPERREYLFYV